MVPILHPLPLDWTASARTNYVINEGHSLGSQYDDPYRIIVMDKGYFYLNDLQVFDSRRRELKRGTDYQCLAMNKAVVNKTSFNACAVIVITNPSIGDNVWINARMVGGEYCSVNAAIVQMAQHLLAGGIRKIYWKNIKDKPDAFKPNGHFHLLWQLYGFTPPTAVLKRMSASIQLGTKNIFGGMYSNYKTAMSQLELDLATSEARLTTHIQDTRDPHGVTKAQIQLSNVYNAPVATQVQAQQASGSIMNYYATPLRAKQSVDVNFTPQLIQHMNNRQNPHGVTAATIGTMTTQQVQNKANLYYNRGQTVTSAYTISNITWAQVGINVRTNIPIVNITSGFFGWNAFTTAAPVTGDILMAGPSGVNVWKASKDLVLSYVTKTNRIYYLATAVAGDPNQNLNNYSTMLGNLIGTWQDEGSILVFKWYTDYGISTGNGAYTTRLESIGVAVKSGARWVFPGY